MKAILLMLALWAHGGSGPVVKIKVASVAPSLGYHQAKLGTSLFEPAKLTIGPLISPELLLQSVPLQNDIQATVRQDTMPTGETYSSISARITQRVAELRSKFEEERSASANALNLSPSIGYGHLAEVAVIRHEGARLINVGEVVRKDGAAVGEIDAETDEHLIEVASGDLNSGKKSKVQQFIKFLRGEAKKRGKAVKYYYDPLKADPQDIERIKKMGEKQGVTVVFVPIPWELVYN
jgi:hypothetical protein